MQNTLPFPPLRPSANEEKSSFNVVIAYEDFETGKHGKSTCDFLAEHLGSEFEFSSQMWKFDVLTVPKLKEMAAKDAAAADIIIVAAHGTGDLPAQVKSWIEMALEEGIHAIGLVALFDDNSGMDSPGRAYLESVALGANLEFFSQPGPLTPAMGESSRAESSSKTLSILASFPDYDRNVSHWGINE